jgi:hypothetical protein
MMGRYGRNGRFGFDMVVIGLLFTEWMDSGLMIVGRHGR